MMLKIKNGPFDNREVNPLSFPIGEGREGAVKRMLDAVRNARDRIIALAEAKKEDDELFAPPRVDKKREELQKNILAEVRNSCNRIIALGRVNNLAELENMQEEVMELADSVLLGNNNVNLGHATLEEFKAACRRWEKRVTS